jgi:RHS repeat-associated protein
LQNKDKHTGSFVYENKTVLQNYAYYPYGMAMPVRPKRSEGGNGLDYTATTTLKNRYLYNSKLERSGNPAFAGELQDDFGLEWYDYGARFYDGELGRWFVLDNLADKYFNLSPYSYAANNPIVNIDINGASTWIKTYKRNLQLL